MSSSRFGPLQHRLTRMIFPKGLLGNVLLGLAAAAGVFVVAFLAAWLGIGSAWGMSHYSYVALTNLHYTIDEYREAKGHLPATLDDVSQHARDGWGNELMYSRSGPTYQILSLGRDGRPGGEGLDADVSLNDLRGGAGAPTLRQFLFQVEIGGVVRSSLLAAAFTFVVVLVFSLEANPERSRFELAVIGLSIAVTMGGAIATAVFISALTVPSGH